VTKLGPPWERGHMVHKLKSAKATNQLLYVNI
jgi:hypothetical protein